MPDRAASTAIEMWSTPAQSSAVPTSTAVGTATAPTSDSPVRRWVALQGSEGGTAYDFSYGPTVGMGSTVVQQSTEGKVNSCTAGWPVFDAKDRVGFLTAGHCDANPGAATWMYLDANRSQKRMLNAYERSVGTVSNGTKLDAAVFFLTPEQQANRDYANTVTKTVRIKDYLSPAQTKALPVGTPVCMRGGRAGTTCGPLISATDYDIEWGGYAIQGDSGAGVFVVDANMNAYAIGLLSSGPDDYQNRATHIEPVLNRWGLKLMTTPN